MILISCYSNSCLGQIVKFYHYVQMVIKTSSFQLLIVTIILTALIVIFNTGVATG